MQQEGKGAGQCHGMQPNNNNLNLVQASGPGILVGMREQSVQVLKKEIAACQRPDKQCAEDHSNDRINIIHACKMGEARPSGKIQTAIFPT
jgi:hypothetical protein